MSTMARVLLPIVLLAGIAIAAPAPQAADKIVLKSVTVDLPAGDRMFPDGPGADAVNNNCLACHSAGMVLNQPALAKPQWEALVTKMRATYKAPIDPKDVDAIVAYLAAMKPEK
jgi:mono/diheme cytochrome c family protein